MRRDDRGAVPILMVGAVLIVVVLLVFVATAWLGRADDYANDPADPPEDVEDEDSEPRWQGRVAIPTTVTFTQPAGAIRPRVDKVTLGECNMGNFGEYDGQPWSPWETLTFYDFDSPSSVKATYTVTMDNGVVSLTHTDTALIKKEFKYFSNIKTDWWFFWEEHEDVKWTYDVTVKAGGVVSTQSGWFSISSTGTLSQ